jgi:hypothetical protein
MACHCREQYPAWGWSQAAGKIEFGDCEQRLVERGDLAGGEQQGASKREINRKPALGQECWDQIEENLSLRKL